MLNEQEMKLAKELARKLSSVGGGDEEQVLNDIRRFISTIKNVWQGVVETIGTIVETFEELLSRKSRPKWDVPLKINPPPMPDFVFPKMQLARSNL